MVPVFLALGGCASLSEDQCRSGSWQDIGYRDGVRGARATRAEDHATACAEYGIPLDREAWREGYERGLETYCTPDNGVREGLAGNDYAGVCPPELDLGFANNWRAGREVFEQRQRVAQLESRRRELEYVLNESEDDKARYNARAELRRLYDQLRYEHDRLYYAESRLDRLLRGVP